MADFIFFDGTSSDLTLGDGVGSALVETVNLTNAADDLLVLLVTASNNNGAVTFTDPGGGWTSLDQSSQGDTRAAVYWKRSTGAELFPDVAISASREWATCSVVVKDVNWSISPDPIGNNTVANTAYGPSITTSAPKSIVLWLLAQEDDVFSATAPITAYSNANQRLGGTWSQFATTEGDSVHAAAAYAFIYNSGTTLTGPTFSTGGDKRHYSIEIYTNGNLYPVASDTLPITPLGQTSEGSSNLWIDAVMASGASLYQPTVQTWTFNAAAVTTGTLHSIPITNHGIVSSRVVRVENNGATLPTGLVHNSYYYVRYVDANNIRLVGPIAPDIDATSELYANGTALLTAVNITAAGTGTCLLRDCGLFNSSGTDNIYYFSSGSASLADASGYNGNSGWLNNTPGFGFYFSTPKDLSSSVFTCNLVNRSTTVDEYHCLFIDSTNNWCLFKVYQRSIDGIGAAGKQIQIDISSAAVRALALKTQGTFVPSAVSHIVFLVIANPFNGATARSYNGAAFSLESLVNPFIVYGGSISEPLNIFSVSSAIQVFSNTLALTPSDLQVVLNLPVIIGNGTNATYFSTSEKSIAFPPLADGITRLTNYIENLGFAFNLANTDAVTLVNCQIGATAPFDFDVTASGSATIVMTGNTLVNANPTLSDDTYDSFIFIGGNGVVDNGATITGSTFIVTNDLGSDNGLVTWASTTDITDSTFELQTGITAGHGIIIATPGSYTFNKLKFVGFGADGTSTAAVYNNSGGLVTITIDGGTVPSVRNGVGATTNIIAGAVTVKVTVVDENGSPVTGARVYCEAGTGGPAVQGTVILNGLTDVNGVVQDTGYIYSANQLLQAGRVRKGPPSPIYKASSFSGTITSSGFSTTVTLISDE